MPVKDTHPHYDAMAPEWSKLKHVCSSQTVVQDMKEVYLPKLDDMTDDQYDAYRARASFITFTKRTIEAFTGMVMRKDVLTDNVETENVDGKGGDLNSYVKKVLDNYLTYGRGGTLVDTPAVEGTITVADAEKRNIKPRLLYYSHDSIINWKKTVHNNIEVLQMVVLQEDIDEGVDEFSHDIKSRYRVLDLANGFYRQRVFDDGGTQVGSDIYPTMDGKKLDYIPFIIHGGINVSYPPLLAVADQNLKLYRQDADYQHGLHYVALPTPWIAGVAADDENAPKSIGPTKLWYLPEEGSCGMLEFTGAGLSGIAKAMEATLDTIVILASRILAPEKSSNDESALAAAIRATAETSTLAGIVAELTTEFKLILGIKTKWEGNRAEDISVKINPDFMPMALTGADMLSYVTAWIKGGISYESLFETLKRGEIIDGERKMEEEFADITAEQKQRMAEEIEKAEKLGKTKEDKDLPNADIKQDRQLKE